jgi:phage N-6-adenine-methyltransferase
MKRSRALAGDSDEWNTPPELLEPLGRFAGPAGVGLDPCGNARSSIGRVTWTKADDGLPRSWCGLGLVFVNPPYSRGQIDAWAGKAAQSAALGVEIVMLVNNKTETKWYELLRRQAKAIVMPAGRIRFLDLDGRRVGAGWQGQTIFYFGERQAAFAREFGPLGWLLRRVDHWEWGDNQDGPALVEALLQGAYKVEARNVYLAQRLEEARHALARLKADLDAVAIGFPNKSQR